MAGLNIPCTRDHRQSTERKHLERREAQERKRAGEMSTGTQGDSQYTKNTIIDEHRCKYMQKLGLSIDFRFKLN